jgi:hypothetical protein
MKGNEESVDKDDQPDKIIVASVTPDDESNWLEIEYKLFINTEIKRVTLLWENVSDAQQLHFNFTSASSSLVVFPFLPFIPPNHHPIMSQSPTINGLDSPPPPPLSHFQIDATPPRPRPANGGEQLNLFFSPAVSEAPSARGGATAAEGSYIRHKSPPQVYTRTARARAFDDDEEEEDEEQGEERRGGQLPLPDPKRQRQRANNSSVVPGRNRAVPSAQNQASALALFDDLDPDPLSTSSTSLNNRNGNGSGNSNGNRNANANAAETLFDPLRGPVGMMEDDAVGGRAREGEEGKKRSMPKMDVER